MKYNFVIEKERREAESISNDQYYEYLIDTYQNLIYSICFKIVSDYFEAEDLAQETFLSAYKSLSSFDRKYEKAWLSRIATNKCLDYIKCLERLNIPMEEEYFLTQEDKGPTTEERALAREAKEQLIECCHDLKPPYQEIALDHFYYELSATDIALKSGKNLKTVQTQIYRARAMLRKSIRKESFDEGKRVKYTN